MRVVLPKPAGACTSTMRPPEACTCSRMAWRGTSKRELTGGVTLVREKYGSDRFSPCSRVMPVAGIRACGSGSPPLVLLFIRTVAPSCSHECTACGAPPVRLQRAADQVLHGLVGAGVDRLDARIDIHAGDGVLEHVAVAAEQLQAAVHHRALLFANPP